MTARPRFRPLPQYPAPRVQSHQRAAIGRVGFIIVTAGSPAAAHQGPSLAHGLTLSVTP